MFDVLFTYPKIRARHQTATGAAERERYLTHCASQGLARETLLRIARELLVVAERLDVTGGNQITRREVEEAARNWVRHQRRRGVRVVESGHVVFSCRSPPTGCAFSNCWRRRQAGHGMLILTNSMISLLI